MNKEEKQDEQLTEEKKIAEKDSENKEKLGAEKTSENVNDLSSDEKRDERAAIAYIYSTQNNTFVHITDLAGNTLSRVSGGMVTKHSRLKADPTVAMFVAKRDAERAKDFGITALYIRTRAKTGGVGMGPGAHAAVKSLSKESFRIINILDTTRMPRGGPKKKGGKRGRRV